MGEIDSIAVSVRWRDGRVTAVWSNTDGATLALLVLALDEAQRLSYRGEIEG